MSPKIKPYMYLNRRSMKVENFKELGNSKLKSIDLKWDKLSEERIKKLETIDKDIFKSQKNKS